MLKGHLSLKTRPATVYQRTHLTALPRDRTTRNPRGTVRIRRDAQPPAISAKHEKTSLVHSKNSARTLLGRPHAKARVLRDANDRDRRAEQTTASLQELNGRTATRIIERKGRPFRQTVFNLTHSQERIPIARDSQASCDLSHPSLDRVRLSAQAIRTYGSTRRIALSQSQETSSKRRNWTKRSNVHSSN